MPDSPFRTHARRQAGWCQGMGSPFTALLCDLIADRLDPATALGQQLDNWPGDPQADVVALRVTGALHDRVRRHLAPELASLYPPAPLPLADRLWAALEPELAHPSLPGWLSRAPQTNEVGRSAALMPCFLTVAALTGLPLALVELGCSGGLNLLPDRYRYRLGTLDAGDPDSALALAPHWVGPNPPDVPLRIASRIGVDLAPPDLALPDERARMLAYIWPDQPERLERMATAMAIASEAMPRIVAADAADFLEATLRLKKGVATTVFHSIAMQYFPAPAKARIAARMARTGARATRESPLAWVRYELDDPTAMAPAALRLTLWPGGEERLLGHAHPHGSAVIWA